MEYTRAVSNNEENENNTKNIIWCNKCVSGEKYYFIFMSLFLISFPYIIMLITFIQIKEYLSIIPPFIITSIAYISMIFCLFRGGCTDPGILEKQNVNYFYVPKRPIIRQVNNGHLINVNYCFTCSFFRPPRTSHCKNCDNCVLRFDHHCFWLGNCIGMRNYKFFYILVSLLNFMDIFQVIYSGYCIIYLLSSNDINIKHITFIYTGLSIIIFFDIMFLIFFIGKLFIIHTKLIFNNLTFIEYFKKKWNKPPGFNPYQKAICRNSRRLLCYPSPKNNKLFFNDYIPNHSETVGIVQTNNSITKTIPFQTN